jgi:hypothetical protein
MTKTTMSASNVYIVLLLTTVAGLISPTIGFSLSPSTNTCISRREAIEVAILGGSVSSLLVLPPLPSNAEDGAPALYESRNRNSNKGAIVREDYWYMMGRTPPRKMGEGMMKSDDPKWNAFGTCQSNADGSSNSCTYVPLKQRIPAYSKYSFLIKFGAKDFARMGTAINAGDWEAAESYLVETSVPAPLVDALLKMVLFGSCMLTTPNYSGPSRELLVARFYVNEVGFATKEVAAAIEARDSDRAKAAFEFGRDSWNSYLTIVNRQITEKVGDKFELI